MKKFTILRALLIIIASALLIVLLITLIHHDPKDKPVYTSLNDMQMAISNECSNAADICLFENTERYRFSESIVNTKTVGNDVICTGYSAYYEPRGDFNQQYDGKLYQIISIYCNQEVLPPNYPDLSHDIICINNFDCDIYSRKYNITVTCSTYDLWLLFEFDNMFYTFEVLNINYTDDVIAVQTFITETKPIISNIFKIQEN